MKTRVVGIIMLAIAPMTADAKEMSWLCQVKGAAGFAHENGNWKPTVFRADGSFIISKKKFRFGDEVGYTVTETGDELPSYDCNEGSIKKGYLRCKGIVGTFVFNVSNLRFLTVFEGGYLGWMKENFDTPGVQIGVCSPI